MNRRVSEAGQSALARTCKTSGNLHFHVQNRQEWRMFPSHHEFGDTSGSCYNRQRLLFSWKAVPMPASLRHFENQGTWLPSYKKDVARFFDAQISKLKSCSCLHEKAIEFGNRQTWESSDLRSKSADFECLQDCESSKAAKQSGASSHGQKFFDHDFLLINTKRRILSWQFMTN